MYIKRVSFDILRVVYHTLSFASISISLGFSSGLIFARAYEARFEFVQAAFLRRDHLPHAFRRHLLHPSVKREVKGRYHRTASF